MIEFGRALKEAREAKGYSISQIAEMTRIMSAMIEDLEHENFSRIAAPIYGRGFVKLYCEAVGLDPKPMIAEFMDIYNGNRELGIKERARKVEIPQPVEKPRVEPRVEPPIQPQQDDFFTQPSEPEIHPETEIQSEPEEAPAAPVRRQPRFSNYSAPLHDSFDAFSQLVKMQRAILRWAVLVGIGLIILWGLVAGIRVLYRATSADDGSKPSTVETIEPQEAPNTQERMTVPRTPHPIPPLYID